MRKLNNKGYMLVEIILAFALAFGIAYFILDLTINLKNKNDDLMVETLVTTDQTIIANKIMEKILENNNIEDFDCSKISKSDQTIKYGDDLIVVVNDYAEVGDIICSNELGAINVKVSLSVKQMSDKNFDAVIDYKYDIGDKEKPSCSLSVTSSGISFASKNDDLGIVAYGISASETPSYDGNDSLALQTGTIYGYVKDVAGKEGICSVNMEEINVKHDGPNCGGKTFHNGQCCNAKSGGCNCRKASEVGSANGSCFGSTCYCPDGYIPAAGGNYCSQTVYSNCTAPWYNTRYICNEDDGYTNVNDSYCYKLG